MANNQIPISYVVSASAVLPQAGLEPLKLSTILLLTDEEPVTELETTYEIYRTVTSAVKTWGTESKTTKMLQAIFGQTPNILNNNGYVIVAPFKNVGGSHGTLTTGNLTLDNFKAVSDGVLNITVDGIVAELEGLDFTDVTSLEDIAEIINTQVSGVSIRTDENKLVFTSSSTGTLSAVTISQKTVGTGTDLYGSTLLNGATCIVTTGTASVQESYSTAITRLSSEIYFNAILTTRELSDGEAVSASNTVEALKPARILVLESNDTNALTSVTGLFSRVENNIYTKTLLYTFGEDSRTNAKLYASGYISKLLSVNYNGSNTCITMNLKDLSGIQADSNISETILERCKGVGCDVYASVEGLSKVLSNRKGAYYIDQIQNLIWFVNTIQRTVFNELATTRTKIPQTESGMQIITNAISSVCTQAVRNGYLHAGTWNSADTFGEYEDFMRNIEENGYYIYHLPIAQQIQAEREERIAPMFQIAGKEAGAVHSANVLIYVEP